MNTKVAFVILVMLIGLMPILILPSSYAAGTSVTATKTATGFWTETITYDWTIQKAVTPTYVEIKPGGTATVAYTLTATRTMASTVDEFGVSGEICVTNGGAVATTDLTIVDQVEYNTGSGDGFQELTGASQTITPAQLAPYTTSNPCYQYKITFTPVVGAVYRNVAHVTITNHSGHQPGDHNCPGTSLCPFGPDPKADFSLPSEPTIVLVDAAADVTEFETCPTGFTCVASDLGPWHLTDSDTISFTKDITNTGVGVACDYTYTLPNTVTLTESDTGQTHTSSVSVSIYTGPCVGGCTLTIGYWKTHAGFTGNNLDHVTQYLPINLGSITVTDAPTAVLYLSFYGSNNQFDASNGINKLYAQLLAAKLNIANGADGSAVASTISAANTYLLTHNSLSWSSLTKAQKATVLGWMSTLDDYNNGLTGPGHCLINPPPPV